MQKVILDCKTQEVAYVDLSKPEELERLRETKEAEDRARMEVKLLAKKQLATNLAELREMKELKDVFTAEDIEAKQAEVDSLKAMS